MEGMPAGMHRSAYTGRSTGIAAVGPHHGFIGAKLIAGAQVCEAVLEAYKEDATTPQVAPSIAGGMAVTRVDARSPPDVLQFFVDAGS